MLRASYPINNLIFCGLIEDFYIKISDSFPERFYKYILLQFRKHMTKRIWLILIIILVVAVFSPIAYWNYGNSGESDSTPFFGISFGGKTANEAKLLIDKVKGYTNFFLVDSFDVTTNETALTEVCDYAAKADLNFQVFFSWVSRLIYPWHQNWLDMAKIRWGDKFLGVYLFDEPGGNQIDTGGWNEDLVEVFKNNASTYSEASDLFVNSISSINSTLDLKRRSITMVTSDYALYWFDYLAGYDTVYVEFGWNNSRPQQIGLCRGAATAQGKEWGAIITWTHDNPPYLASGPEILDDMLIAYETGAKYVIVFNYPTYPENNPYGILGDEHFGAMQQFWKHIQEYPGDYGKVLSDVAFVLPKDYGWGMRRPDDSIWGLWQADNLSSVIWDKMNTLVERYELGFDIVYDDPRFSLAEYSKVYYWNSSAT